LNCAGSVGDRDKDAEYIDLDLSSPMSPAYIVETPNDEATPIDNVYNELGKNAEFMYSFIRNPDTYTIRKHSLLERRTKRNK